MLPEERHSGYLGQDGRKIILQPTSVKILRILLITTLTVTVQSFHFSILGPKILFVTQITCQLCWHNPTTKKRSYSFLVGG
jgi:hypothetical protein